MYVHFTIINYPRLSGIAGFFSMMFFRFFLSGRNDFVFYKLMGTGLNGSFDLRPDTRQWVIMSFSKTDVLYGIDKDSNTLIRKLYGKAISGWIKFFRCETAIFHLKIFSGHGSWDGKVLPAEKSDDVNNTELLAVFTRATIRLNKLRAFWKEVPKTNQKSREAEGLLFSIGTGEAPAIRQATFSIWRSLNHMKCYAYQTKEHLDVIRKTREEGWYSEEMFLRMKLISAYGSVKGKDMGMIQNKGHVIQEGNPELKNEK
ncbi:spheroidene monooxygenase [Pollutibacter soli]|uniref:spheroidene monooxygenase n=1 Tax=Pollutibacter soli TaxID=3034157 RepID=UPI0030133475